MINQINTVAVVAPDPTALETANNPGGSNQSGPAKPVQQAQQGASNSTSSSLSEPATQPSTRLMIDQDKATGAYIYRVVDAVDGRLLAEIPRESLQQLVSSDDYSAGDLISTSV